MNNKEFIPHKYVKNVDIKFTLRIPEQKHELLSTYATKHDVSLNTLILNCIDYAMDNIKDKEK